MSKLLEIKDLYGGYQEGVNVLQGIDALLLVNAGLPYGVRIFDRKCTLGNIVQALQGRYSESGQEPSPKKIEK